MPRRCSPGKGDDKSSSEDGTEYEEYCLSGITELPKATGGGEADESNDLEKKLTDEIVKDLECITVLTKEHLSEKGLLSKESEYKNDDTPNSDQIHIKTESKTMSTFEVTTTKAENISTYTELGPRFTSLTQQMRQALNEMEEQDKQMPYMDQDEKNLDDAIAESTKLDQNLVVDSIQIKTETKGSI